MRCSESTDITYYRENDLRPAMRTVLKNAGKSTFRIPDTDYLTTDNRNVDHI